MDRVGRSIIQGFVVSSTSQSVNEAERKYVAQPTDFQECQQNCCSTFERRACFCVFAFCFCACCTQGPRLRGSTIKVDGPRPYQIFEIWIAKWRIKHKITTDHDQLSNEFLALRLHPWLVFTRNSRRTSN